ncbi:CusA/CzcA family heavy metal efflux RND transporter [Polyangium sorediatum]|uniref:CusA/CzcA family heavy metal efflux RND transporter n=1 Tax=Polyangium sorediatum TaxID=889274 RepID=A0ABT6P789_9BACT|nr:CusA/CzcA family heavy metal efflux RND transporter [Polyangium sorediatum]MDI1436495.1 CusA/CzcA family heavy metal efflux RND transporter [Polyangium sorediatum]
MLSRIVLASIRLRALMLVLFALLLGAGAVAVRALPIDAMPDVSTIQVSVLTSASGLSAVEVERTVTIPVENALNGVPGGAELRSVSRGGLSAVTVVFADGTDVWFARQLVLERLRTVERELPASAGTPELAPVSSGLGEIFQFVVRSSQHSPMQLRTLLDWEIVPKLRGVPGVIEVNTMGGELKQFQVVVDRARLNAQSMTVQHVIEALRTANVNVGGGYVERREESFTVRGQGMLRDEEDIANVVLRADGGGAPVLVKHVADVQIGAALRHGVITHGGESEAVTGIVMMLLGGNSREVVAAVGERVKEIEAELPPGATIEVVYDRADFVGRTISTVLKNLAEGVIVVTIVLALFLGTLRGALAVVLGIPAAMTVAVLGMHAFGVTGDLMSLGAIDFGFLVDGPIVMLEAVIAAVAGQKLAGDARARAYAEAAQGVARPVAFAVAIIMLVYVPLLFLEGIEGKMFRPMALTMACALFGALVYSVLFFPALLVTLVPPAEGHGPRWMEWITARYERIVGHAVTLRWPLLGASAVAFVVTTFWFARAGAEFVPRIFEGDAVVTIRRAPSISLDEARRLDLAAEKVLHGFPEVVSTLGMTGRAEVATDPVGNDNTDILVRLRPTEEWKTARDFDALSEAFKETVEARVPGTFVSVSQPIEDRTNELISGSRADISIKVVGSDIEELAALGDRIGARVKAIRGAGDVRVERLLGQPVISAVADRARMARHGVRVEDAFTVIAAAREGVRVGDIYEDQRKFDLRVLNPPSEPSAAALGELFVETSRGRSVPLREVVTLAEGDGPSSIRRQDRERTVRVDVNLRGRDLVSWVDEAKAAVERDVPLPTGYRMAWGGQFENFERAQKRLALLVPAVVVLIFGMLLWMFQNARLALAVFMMVPLSLVGGMLGLLARGLPFSLSAAVGFIALGGVAVLNGVVIASEVGRRLSAGEALDVAVTRGATAVVRAVLTTAAVAALGFMPMAVAESAGAEVQRPLATVVIFGMFFGTITTLAVLPGVLRAALAGQRLAARAGEEAQGRAYSPVDCTSASGGAAHG